MSGPTIQERVAEVICCPECFWSAESLAERLFKAELLRDDELTALGLAVRSMERRTEYPVGHPLGWNDCLDEIARRAAPSQPEGNEGGT